MLSAPVQVIMRPRTLMHSIGTALTADTVATTPILMVMGAILPTVRLMVAATQEVRFFTHLFLLLQSYLSILGGMNEGYSMSNDRDQLRQNLNQSGNTGTTSAFGTGDLARDTGTGTHYHATDKELATSSTRTGIHSGDGIHSQQYYGRTDVSGGSIGIGHHPHATGQQGQRFSIF